MKTSHHRAHGATWHRQKASIKSTPKLHHRAHGAKSHGQKAYFKPMPTSHQLAHGATSHRQKASIKPRPTLHHRAHGAPWHTHSLIRRTHCAGWPSGPGSTFPSWASGKCDQPCPADEKLQLGSEHDFARQKFVIIEHLKHARSKYQNNHITLFHWWPRGVGQQFWNARPEGVGTQPARTSTCAQRFFWHKIGKSIYIAFLGAQRHSQLAFSFVNRGLGAGYASGHCMAANRAPYNWTSPKGTQIFVYEHCRNRASSVRITQSYDHCQNHPITFFTVRTLCSHHQCQNHPTASALWESFIRTIPIRIIQSHFFPVRTICSYHQCQIHPITDSL